MRATLRFLLRLAVAAMVAAGAHAANYQGLWWNAPAESESGWGINFAHQGDVIFATWFGYDEAGHGLWRVMVATLTPEGTYAGDVLETSGPAFGAAPFDPSRVTRLKVGTGSLSFRDADNGSFTYSVRGVRETKVLARQVFGTLPTCAYEAAPDYATAVNYTDLWWGWGGAESGWGINLAHEGDVIFATWFAYDAFGAPQWLAATAPKLAAGVYGGTLIRTTGPAFGSPFDPSRVTRTPVGTITLAFANGNAATLAYTLDGTTRTRAITRQLNAPPAGTRCAPPAGATLAGRVFDTAPVAARVCADANANGRCDAGEAATTTDAAGAYQLAAPGHAGCLVAEVASGAYRMASPAREYSANITPLTTLVLAAHEPDLRLAEERVRIELGLPPRFAINLAAAPAAGSLTHGIVTAVATALQAKGAALDLSSPTALAAIAAAFPPSITELPQLRIATKDGAAILSREEYVDATYVLTNPAAPTPTATLAGKIRGRGNMSWMQPKKPYKVQFANDAAYAAIADVLGMRKNRNWALLADYVDRTLMRNKLVFTLGNSALFADGIKWTPSAQHLDLWLNDEYQGVYLLAEDIRVDAARLDIRKMGNSEVEGGYLLEVDWPLDCYRDDVVSLQHVTPAGVHVCIKTPDETALTPPQRAYVTGLLDAAEADILAGRIERLNAASFADWYLLNELVRNYDAPFYSSDYLWKDCATAANPADRLLNMGPFWDFDIAAGNLNVSDAWRTEGCWLTRARDGMPNWFASIFASRDFTDLTLARWSQKRQALERLVTASIETFARRLDRPQQRNVMRWPETGATLWNEYWDIPDYAGEVAYLRRFLLDRMAWLDIAYASPEAFSTLCK